MSQAKKPLPRAGGLYCQATRFITKLFRHVKVFCFHPAFRCLPPGIVPTSAGIIGPGRLPTWLADLAFQVVIVSGCELDHDEITRVGMPFGDDHQPIHFRGLGCGPTA